MHKNNSSIGIFQNFLLAWWHQYISLWQQPQTALSSEHNNVNTFTFTTSNNQLWSLTHGNHKCSFTGLLLHVDISYHNLKMICDNHAWTIFSHQFLRWISIPFLKLWIDFTLSKKFTKELNSRAWQGKLIHSTFKNILVNEYWFIPWELTLESPCGWNNLTPLSCIPGRIWFLFAWYP